MLNNILSLMLRSFATSSPIFSPVYVPGCPTTAKSYLTQSVFGGIV